jgi:hypothetical protein
LLAPRIAVATSYRSLSVALHSLEHRLPALLANHFADEHAQHVHVFTQFSVFGGETDIRARHGESGQPRGRAV